MAKYLFEAKYTVEGLKGLKTEGASAREKAVASLAESVGGKLEAFYIAFGDTDVYAIIDFPDNSAAAAAALGGRRGRRSERAHDRAAECQGDRRRDEERRDLPSARKVTRASRAQSGAT